VRQKQTHQLRESPRACSSSKTNGRLRGSGTEGSQIDELQGREQELQAELAKAAEALTVPDCQEELLDARVRRGMLELPNCDDPVFRMWCDACQLTPGKSYHWQDFRIARLQALMSQYDPSYDPESDSDDDYLNPFPR